MIEACYRFDAVEARVKRPTHSAPTPTGPVIS